MFFTRLLKQLTFYDLFICVVNVACFSFVFWKTSECIIKFLDNPRGTKMDIWYTENTDNLKPSFIQVDDKSLFDHLDLFYKICLDL